MAETYQNNQIAPIRLPTSPARRDISLRSSGTVGDRLVCFDIGLLGHSPRKSPVRHPLYNCQESAGSTGGEVLSCGRLVARSVGPQPWSLVGVLPSSRIRGGRMSLDIKGLIAEREVECYQLDASHLNEQMVHVLKTIGFDKRYQRGVGQYLYDEQGERYLDLLSGWGVFAVGHNHPTVREALTAVLDSELPNLVQMGVSALSVF